MVKSYCLVFAFFIIANSSYAELYNSKNKTIKEENFLQTVLFTYENDSVYGPDRYYTNGIQLLFLSKDYDFKNENEYLSKIFHIQNKNFHNFSFGIGQKIYTPYDIKKTELVEDDRPYAGYLYLFLDKNIRYDKNKTDTFGVSIGLTGPASFGEDIQTSVHRWINSPKPDGWSNQLSNEPLFMLSWGRAIELNEKKPFQYDWNLIPKMSFNLGTPFTDTGFAIEYRYGWNLQDDLIANRMRASTMGVKNNNINNNFNDLSYYFFLEGTVNAVLYNTFLDGNISGYKPNICKNLLSYELNGGVTLRLNKIYAKYSTIYLSKEFKEQLNSQIIFSLSIGYLF